MGGVLTHTLVGIISALIVFYFWRKLEFSLATLLGNLIIDFFKFFFSALKQGTIFIFNVEHDSTFYFFANLTNSFTNWLLLGFFALSLVAFLYHHHYIRKKTFLEYDELIWAFLFGISLHLLLDIFYLETSAWI